MNALRQGRGEWAPAQRRLLRHISRAPKVSVMRVRARIGISCLLALVGAALAGAPGALAAAVNDGRDAAPVPLDIRRASAVQLKSGRIQHEVRFYTTTAEAHGTACIAFYRRRGARRPSHTLCFEYDGLLKPQDNNDAEPPIRKCGRFIEEDFNSRSVCDGRVTGDAGINYSATRVKVRFSPRALGRPRAYYFAVKTVSRAETGPPSDKACCDDATTRRRFRLRR